MTWSWWVKNSGKFWIAAPLWFHEIRNLEPIIGPSLTYLLALIFTNLFARIWWQVKYKHRQEWNPHAWDNDIYGVEKGFPSQRQIKDDVRIRLLTAGIILFISYCRNIHNVPLSGNVIFLQIHAHVYSIVTTFFGIEMFEYLYVLIHLHLTSTNTPRKELL